MEFTTKFELQSQATRLVESMCQGTKFPGKNGSFTLSAALFQETWPGNSADNTSPDHNSVHPCGLHRFTLWALPASLAVTRGILVSFFSSA